MPQRRAPPEKRICAACSTQYTINHRLSTASKERSKYCSVKCIPKGWKRRTLRLADIKVGDASS